MSPVVRKTPLSTPRGSPPGSRAWSPRRNSAARGCPALRRAPAQFPPQWRSARPGRCRPRQRVPNGPAQGRRPRATPRTTCTQVGRISPPPSCASSVHRCLSHSSLRDRRCSTMMSPDLSPCCCWGRGRWTLPSLGLLGVRGDEHDGRARRRPGFRPRVRGVPLHVPAARRPAGDGIDGGGGLVVSPWPRARSAGKPPGGLHLGLPARASSWRPGAGCGQSDPSKRESPAGEVRERPNRSHC